MSPTTNERWASVVSAYEAADREWTEATEALEALPPSGIDTREERACDLAREKAYECEDAVLAIRAPSLAGAAYQLKIIASRHHDTEFDDPSASASPTLEGEALKHIYELMQVTARRLSFEDGEMRAGPNWKLLAWPIGGFFTGLIVVGAWIVYLNSL